MEGTQTTGRAYTSLLTEDGERELVEIPPPIPWVPVTQPIALDTPYQEYAAEQAANYTRQVLFDRNAGAWLRERVEALSEQGDFTPNATLKVLVEEYVRKAMGL